DLDDELFLVLHLMIAGRLHWKARGAKPPGKIGLAAFDFANGTLILTEAGTKKRAALHLVRGEDRLREHQPGSLEVLKTVLCTFRRVRWRRNQCHNPPVPDARPCCGCDSASRLETPDRPRLSPLTWTSRLTADEIARLFEAMRVTLTEWLDRLR